MTRRSRFLLLAALLLPALASAHSVGLSRGEYALAGSQVQATLAFARDELAAALPAIDANRDGDFTAQELVVARADLDAVLQRQVVIAGDGQPCPGSVTALALVEGNGVEAGMRFACAQPPKTLELQFDLFKNLSFGHRHLAHQAGTPADATAVLFETAARWQLASVESVPVGDHASVFGLGITHILTGYDHLVFLLGLILVGRRLTPLLVLVSAFTAGHMISFGLAALDVWVPDPGIIEPLIALSIAYVGIENWLVRDHSHRWMLAFPFGLLHGFGFGGAMRELAVPADQLLPSLLSFNLGVEAGQIAVLAMLLPALWCLRRNAVFEQYGTQAVSGLIVVAGLGWFVERVVG